MPIVNVYVANSQRIFLVLLRTGTLAVQDRATMVIPGLPQAGFPGFVLGPRTDMASFAHSEREASQESLRLAPIIVVRWCQSSEDKFLNDTRKGSSPQAQARLPGDYRSR